MTTEPHTFNIPDCTCGRDHDQIGFLTTSTLAMLEELAQPYTPDEVGAYVADAAEHVGWHRDPEKATATFNREDCTCLEDHDGLLHIVKGAVFVAMQAPFTVGQIRDLVDTAVAKVGWVKA